MGVHEERSGGIPAGSSRMPRVQMAFRPLLVASLLLVGMIATGQGQSADPVRLVSVGINATSANGASSGVAVNFDGTVAAFYSDATDLIVGDTNQARDVFVRDLTTGATERVSVSSTGRQANRASHAAGGSTAISSDGQIVAFYSLATNLVDLDTNQQPDVFVRLRATGTTQRVSIASDGTEANGPSVFPSLSADGRFVAFQSAASNLVAGDTNHVADIFVHDRFTGTTARVCSIQGNLSSSTPAISADGSVVAFSSTATNLVSGDTNERADIFVCDRNTGAVERVSVSSSGEEGNGDSILPAISGDGRYVGFKSLADNLVPGDRNNVVDVLVRDRVSRTTERVSVNLKGGDVNDVSFPPSLSNDGRFVAFSSFGTNLVANDANLAADVFVRDRCIGVTLIVDVNDNGEPANGSTPDVPPAISGDGKRIGFVSLATNLAANDHNEAGDVYVAPNPFFGPGSCPGTASCTVGSCPGDQVCVQGFCAAPTKTPTLTRTPTPTRTGTPTLTPTPTPTFRLCVDDSDCRPDEQCRAGFCKKKRKCDDTDPTVDRLACFDREACIGGLCECGGDCNLDGVVLGNEITNAVYVLGGLIPLTLCSSADINGDGQVMGNEITQAVLNLGRGCAQEGQPLIFAHDRGGLVTLTVGSATVAGNGTAVISVDLTGGGGEVATAQLDLLFDPNVLDIGDAGRSCSLEARLTSQILLATLPDTPPAPAGLKRLRLFVGDLSDPIAQFADGRIVTCTFQVNAAAPTGATTLAADRLNVGDARADTFGTSAVSGGVSILLPEPSPLPTVTAPAACPGDCDGDGEVFGNEVTIVVQTMAGLLPLTECPAADADGDGEVLVTDVTRAVISLGRGCSQ